MTLPYPATSSNRLYNTKQVHMVLHLHDLHHSKFHRAVLSNQVLLVEPILISICLLHRNGERLSNEERWSLSLILKLELQNIEVWRYHELHLLVEEMERFELKFYLWIVVEDSLDPFRLDLRFVRLECLIWSQDLRIEVDVSKVEALVEAVSSHLLSEIRNERRMKRDQGYRQRR